MTGDKAHYSFGMAGDPARTRAPHRPRVFILSESCLFREGVALALAQQSSVQVIGSSDLSLPLRQISDLTPDAVLLDITDRSSLAIATALRDAMPTVKIVALGVVEVEQVVMACADAGIAGFVALSGSAKDVVAAVHSAVRGELVCSPRTAGMLLKRVRTLAGSPPGNGGNGVGNALTRREREIAQLMSDGLSNKQIALSLGIRNATVKNHIHSVLGKLRVHRRGEAVARLHQAGIEGPRKPVFPKRYHRVSVGEGDQAD